MCCAYRWHRVWSKPRHPDWDHPPCPGSSVCARAWLRVWSRTAAAGVGLSSHTEPDIELRDEIRVQDRLPTAQTSAFLVQLRMPHRKWAATCAHGSMAKHKNDDHNAPNHWKICTAPSGRAKCTRCKRGIEAGDWRH